MCSFEQYLFWNINSGAFQNDTTSTHKNMCRHVGTLSGRYSDFSVLPTVREEFIHISMFKIFNIYLRVDYKGALL